MEHNLDRRVMRAICWCSLASILSVLILQIIIRSGWDRGIKRQNLTRCHSQHNKRFYRTLIAVYLSLAVNASQSIILNYGWPECSNCNEQVLAASSVYCISRVLIWLFLLQRATMSQCIDPTLGSRWFSHYIPVGLICMGVSSVFIPVIQRKEYKMDCFQFDEHNYCELRIEWSVFMQIIIYMGAVTEIAIDTGLLYLFIKPIIINTRRQTSSNSMDSNKIRSTLRWHIVLSALSLLTSLVIIVGYSIIDVRFEYVYVADRAINAIACFLMLGRNRDWIWKRGLWVKRHVGLADNDTFGDLDTDIPQRCIRQSTLATLANIERFNQKSMAMDPDLESKSGSVQKILESASDVVIETN